MAIASKVGSRWDGITADHILEVFLQRKVSRSGNVGGQAVGKYRLMILFSLKWPFPHKELMGVGSSSNAAIVLHLPDEKVGLPKMFYGAHLAQDTSTQKFAQIIIWCCTKDTNPFVHQYSEISPTPHDVFPLDISPEKHPSFNFSSMLMPENTEENSSLKLSKAKRKNAKKHFGRKFKYDPALMLMGLGKRKLVSLHNGTKDFPLGEKKDSFLPVLGKGNSNARSKRSMKTQPLMLIAGIRESVMTLDMQNNSLLEDKNPNGMYLRSDDQLAYPNVAPYTKYEETEMKYFNSEPSIDFGQNSSYKPQLRDVLGAGKNIQRDSKYDPVVRYGGLGKKGSGSNSSLKYARIGKKRSAYDPALRYMGLGKRSHNFDPALKYMGLGKKKKVPITILH
ncbi:hypothetical protein TNCV_2046921 [Trichonephila clavipes]|uniref:Uncharacterized protein n=1 Tax=Trichonephila clavipes TaxID=2585209 RepID=A0A8X6SU45_TRICX|nr:hypothetical protein TNCV_2046921 [Trichonephila clavipes]